MLAPGARGVRYPAERWEPKAAFDSIAPSSTPSPSDTCIEKSVRRPRVLIQMAGPNWCCDC